MHGSFRDLLCTATSAVLRRGSPVQPLSYYSPFASLCQATTVSCHQTRLTALTLEVQGRTLRALSTTQSLREKMASNGEVRRKRKESPVLMDDRPPKLLKPELSNILNGDEISESENGYVLPSEEDDEKALLSAVTATADTAEWQATIERVVKNVVSIHFCQTCSFDTDPAMSSEATGFVVDAKKGYILTNRHVVGAGPFWGYCIFDNHEEVSLTVTESTDFDNTFADYHGSSVTCSQSTEILCTTSASYVSILQKSNTCPFPSSL